MKPRGGAREGAGRKRKDHITRSVSFRVRDFNFLELMPGTFRSDKVHKIIQFYIDNKRY